MHYVRLNTIMNVLIISTIMVWQPPFLFALHTAHYQDHKKHYTYLYPVDTIVDEENREKICVLYQNEKTQLILYFWDPETKKAVKGISSCYTPAGLVSFAHKKMFSFVDNDQLRLKKIIKRSPVTVPLCGPYDLTMIHWIDDSTCYFGAWERGTENLFSATITGTVYRLTASITTHYCLPSKVEDRLFFIAKDGTKQSLVSASYPVIEKKAEWESQEDIFNKTIVTSIDTLLIFDSSINVLFLKMETKTDGFFVYTTHTMTNNSFCYQFSCACITKKAETWHVIKLFDFYIPKAIFSEKTAFYLYESLFPFFPKKRDFFFYFSSYDEGTQAVELYAYSIETNSTKKISCHAQGEYPICLFSPIYCAGVYYYGGLCSVEPSEEDEDGFVSFSLPSFFTCT